MNSFGIVEDFPESDTGYFTSHISKSPYEPNHLVYVHKHIIVTINKECVVKLWFKGDMFHSRFENDPERHHISIEAFFNRDHELGSVYGCGIELLCNKRLRTIVKGLNDYIDKFSVRNDFWVEDLYIGKNYLSEFDLENIDYFLNSDRAAIDKWMAFASYSNLSETDQDFKQKMVEVFDLRESFQQCFEKFNLEKNDNFYSYTSFLTPLFPFPIFHSTNFKHSTFEDFLYLSNIVNNFNNMDCVIENINTEEWRDHISVDKYGKSVGEFIDSYLSNSGTVSKEDESKMTVNQFHMLYSSLQLFNNKKIIQMQYDRVMSGLDLKNKFDNKKHAYLILTKEEAEIINSALVNDSFRYVEIKLILQSEFFVKYLFENKENFGLFLNDFNNLYQNFVEAAGKENIRLQRPVWARKSILEIIATRKEYTEAFDKFMKDPSIPLGMAFSIEGLINPSVVFKL